LIVSIGGFSAVLLCMNLSMLDVFGVVLV
jgi:hypothetical protein